MSHTTLSEQARIAAALQAQGINDSVAVLFYEQGRIAPTILVEANVRARCFDGYSPFGAVMNEARERTRDGRVVVRHTEVDNTVVITYPMGV